MKKPSDELLVCHWEGHKFGTWYPWPAQVPTERTTYIVAYLGATGVARFTPNKAGNGGRWSNGIDGHSCTTYVRFWMPMPEMPNQQINEKESGDE